MADTDTMTDRDRSDESRPVETEAVKEQPKQERGQDAPNDHTEPEPGARGGSTKTKKKSHKGAFFVALLALAGIGVAGYLYSDRLMRLLPSQSQPPEPHASSETTPPQAAPAEQTAKTQVVVVPPPHDNSQRPSERSESAEATEQLLAAMQDLSEELARFRQEQRSLSAALRELQQMNLHVRLHWIIDPAARLPQIKLAWEEISLLPGLTDQQRAVATRMHQLAGNDLSKLQQWRAALLKWADAVAYQTHEDVLPRPEHPWLAWIVGQFHLYRAPGIEERKFAALRKRLLHAAHLLSLESWPAQDDWQELRAQLLLALKTSKAGNAASIELGLPNNFSAIQKDIQILRDTARDWLEQ